MKRTRSIARCVGVPLVAVLAAGGVLVACEKEADLPPPEQLIDDDTVAEHLEGQTPQAGGPGPDGPGARGGAQMGGRQGMPPMMGRGPRGGPQALLARGFEDLDTDGDGEILPAEAAEAIRGIMEEADANGDGVVTREELGGPGGMPGMMPPPRGRRGPGGQGGRRMPGGPPGAVAPEGGGQAEPGFRGVAGPNSGESPPEGAPAMAPSPGMGPGGIVMQRFDEWDENGDGKVTEEELPQQASQMLRFLDRDNDGAISKEEVETMGLPGGRPGAPGSPQDGAVTGPSE